MRRIFILLLCLCALGSCYNAHANHLLGGEINYKLVSTSGNTQVYRVTLSLFADCASNVPGGAFQALTGATPEVKLYKGTAEVSAMALSYNAAESNIEITPVCPDEAGNTTCVNINNPVPGIKKFVYNRDFTVTDTSSNWRFAFEGSIPNNGMGIQTSAGRSLIIQNAQITDPISGTTTIMYLEATLNNTTGPNNSTTFTSLPTPFFCLNKASTYSLGAADEENDQLAFSLIPGKVVPGTPPFIITDIGYIPPFTALAPLPTAPGNFSFNNASGQMIFTPNQVMNCLVVNLVEEFRNGVRVGSSMREMTFVILDNCTNDAPFSPVSDIRNATIVSSSSDNLVLSVCEGQTDNISFDIASTDPNGDNTTVTYSNLPAGATITVTGNGADSPVVHFEWSAIDAAPGNYIFYITYTDDGCPLVSTKTVAYTIQILPHINIFDGGSSASCAGSANGKAWAIPNDPNLVLDYNYRWVDASGNELRNTNSDHGDTLSNIPPGRYKVYIRNADGCGKNVFVDVQEIPLPVVELFPGDTLLCAGLPIQLHTVEQPDVSYLWSTGDTTCCITVTEPDLYVLRATNKCGHTEDNVKIDYVKCNYCLFVPNAFSPNGDGHNDRFNILETCLIDKFKLQIFNRWGELVFTTLSTGKSWDGTYNGQQAETGVYFYVIDALPTDRSKGTIQLKGDLTLIR